MSSTDQIHRLPDHVVSGIAAGEVVERPASVIKELVENAIDAGATRVEVEYRDKDGRVELSVRDDGHGIPEDQLDLAVARHATSKLSSLDDLTGVPTFGFRGEALASIAAVSTTEVTSRIAGSDAGARILVENGFTQVREPVSSRPGTCVRVVDLFASVPARRKFLKSATAELAAVSEHVRRFSLSRPEVHFSVSKNGKTSLDLPRVPTLKDRLVQVYGRETGASMVEIEGRHGGFELRGAITPAGVSFGSSRRISLFVGDRYVTDKLLFRAVMEGYRTYLLKRRYPAAVIFLDVPADRVDVNVHPAKLEVRFDDPQAVSAFVTESVAAGLRGNASPLGRWGLTERDIAATEAFVKRTSRRPDPPAAPSAPVRTESNPVSDDASRVAEPIPGYTESAAAPTEQEMIRESEPLPLGALPKENTLGTLTVVGQVFDGYIVCDAGNEVVLVDQHAAHERILFERLMADYDAGSIERQPLLIPQTVHVGGDGVEAIAKHEAELAAIGWEVAPFGDEDIVVRCVPAISAGADATSMSEALVSDLVATHAGGAARKLAEQVYATVACHSAVRVGKRLDLRAAAELLREAATVDFSACCPHGRPVARTMTRGAVERMFGR